MKLEDSMTRDVARGATRTDAPCARPTVDFNAHMSCEGTTELLVAGRRCRLVAALRRGLGGALVLHSESGLSTVWLGTLPESDSSLLGALAETLVTVHPGVMDGAASHSGTTVLALRSGHMLELQATLKSTHGPSQLPIRFSFPASEFERGSARVWTTAGAVHVAGWLGTDAIAAVHDALRIDDTVQRLVLSSPQPGAASLAATHCLGRLVRSAGLATLVPRDTVVRGCAVDLLMAGTAREVHVGSRLLAGADLVCASHSPRVWQAAAEALRVYAKEMLGDAGEAYAARVLHSRARSATFALGKRDFASLGIAVIGSGRRGSHRSPAAPAG